MIKEYENCRAQLEFETRLCGNCGTPQPLHPLKTALNAFNLARHYSDIAYASVLFLATALTINTIQSRQ